MSCILENLYMGGVEEAAHTESLQKKGVTHILTIDVKPLHRGKTEGFQYKYVHALDMPNTDLLRYFEECISFIEEGRQAGGAIVHCLVGQSRSATIITAYVMQKLGMGFDESLALVRKFRPQVKPNYGFISQLRLFESMGNRVDPQNDQYKMYRLSKLALQIQSGQQDDPLSEDVMSADPLHGHAGEVFYKCRKCRRPLFKSSAILPHDTGQGEAAFDWRGQIKRAGSNQESRERCSQSLFIEPVQWMAGKILSLDGKILCPKCSAKIGSFNWIGERCPCGTWVTPAFHVQNNKVDECKPSSAHTQVLRPQRHVTKGASLQADMSKNVSTCAPKPDLVLSTELETQTLQVKELPPLDQ